MYIALPPTLFPCVFSRRFIYQRETIIQTCPAAINLPHISNASARSPLYAAHARVVRNRACHIKLINFNLESGIRNKGCVGCEIRMLRCFNANGTLILLKVYFHIEEALMRMVLVFTHNIKSIN
jgi:hypothetical protein